jgi:hypothetical protein
MNLVGCTIISSNELPMQSRLISSTIVRRPLVDEIDMVRSILTANIEEYVGFLSEAHI